MRKQVNRIRIRQKLKAFNKKQQQIHMLYDVKLNRKQYNNMLNTKQWFYYNGWNQNKQIIKKNSQKKLQQDHQGNQFVSLPVSPKGSREQKLGKFSRGHKSKGTSKNNNKQHRKIITQSYSPYIRDGKQYQRLISKLKPIHGPTQSIIKQIQDHNNNNWKNTQSVLLASKQSFKDKIVRFLNRIGLKNYQKIFIINSKDRHIKQALIRNGWVQAVDSTSLFFHLKWVYTDSLIDYQNLQVGQYFNHFKNNQELTNKNLLKKNINKSQWYLQPNYPMTYDFQLRDDQIKFQCQFYHYQCFNILYQLYKIIVNNFNRYYLNLIKNNCLGIVKGNKFMLNIQKIKQKHFIKILQPQYFNHQSKTQQKKYRDLLYKFYFQLLHIIQYTNHIKNKKQYKKPIINYPKIQLYQIQNYFQGDTLHIVLNTLQYDKFLLVNLLLIYEQSKQHFDNNFGINNWWIIKPTGVSRGTGIKIQKDYLKIINSKYGKIAQKYIQRPLLLNCNRKFDIRQWVLVKSFFPLDAYIFQKSYCRFSASKYTEQNYQNLIVHLTNYSKQKQIYERFGNCADSIMSQDELQQQINKISNDGNRWKLIKKQIKQQILKTLKCCQHQIVNRVQCFQVYGFDILLDREFKPWVLEVNMSPACEKRAEFLNQYLRKMADGVIDMLEERKIRYWQKIQDNYNQNEQHDVVKQSRIVKSCQLVKQYAACKIQRQYRRYKERKKCTLNFIQEEIIQQDIFHVDAYDEDDFI